MIGCFATVICGTSMYFVPVVLTTSGTIVSKAWVPTIGAAAMVSTTGAPIVVTAGAAMVSTTGAPITAPPITPPPKVVTGAPMKAIVAVDRRDGRAELAATSKLQSDSG